MRGVESGREMERNSYLATHSMRGVCVGGGCWDMGGRGRNCGGEGVGGNGG